MSCAKIKKTFLFGILLLTSLNSAVAFSYDDYLKSESDSTEDGDPDALRQAIRQAKADPPPPPVYRVQPAPVAKAPVQPAAPAMASSYPVLAAAAATRRYQPPSAPPIQTAQPYDQTPRRPSVQPVTLTPSGSTAPSVQIAQSEPVPAPVPAQSYQAPQPGQSQAPIPQTAALASNDSPPDDDYIPYWTSHEPPNPSGLYFSVKAGGLQTDSITRSALLGEEQIGTSNFKEGTGTVRRDYDVGGSYALAIGYRFTPNFRLEAEADYESFNIEQLRPFAANIPQLDGTPYKTVAGGARQRALVLVNGYWDFPTDTPFTPFVGAGIGWQYDFPNTFYLFQRDATHFFTEEGTNGQSGVAMMEIGFAYNFDQNWSLSPSYRYSHEFANKNSYGNESAHLLRMALRYQF